MVRTLDTEQRRFKYLDPDKLCDWISKDNESIYLTGLCAGEINGLSKVFTQVSNSVCMYVYVITAMYTDNFACQF